MPIYEFECPKCQKKARKIISMCTFHLKGGDTMPGFDRTGPMGAGPMTGGARGRCNPATTGTIPAYAGGYGYGRGLGLRREFRGGKKATP